MRAQTRFRSLRLNPPSDEWRCALATASGIEQRALITRWLSCWGKAQQPARGELERPLGGRRLTADERRRASAGAAAKAEPVRQAPGGGGLGGGGRTTRGRRRRGDGDRQDAGVEHAGGIGPAPLRPTPFVARRTDVRVARALPAEISSKSAVGVHRIGTCLTGSSVAPFRASRLAVAGKLHRLTRPEGGSPDGA